MASLNKSSLIDGFDDGEERAPSRTVDLAPPRSAEARHNIGPSRQQGDESLAIRLFSGDGRQFDLGEHWLGQFIR